MTYVSNKGEAFIFFTMFSDYPVLIETAPFINFALYDVLNDFPPPPFIKIPRSLYIEKIPSSGYSDTLCIRPVGIFHQPFTLSSWESRIVTIFLFKRKTKCFTGC